MVGFKPKWNSDTYRVLDMWSMCFCGCSSVRALLRTFIASDFLESSNIGTASAFPRSFIFGVHDIERTTYFSSSARASEITFRHAVSSDEPVQIPLLRRVWSLLRHKNVKDSVFRQACNQIFATYQAVISCFQVSSIVWAVLRTILYQIVLHVKLV